MFGESRNKKQKNFGSEAKISEAKRSDSKRQLKRQTKKQTKTN
jgi:hypothetical protein